MVHPLWLVELTRQFCVETFRKGTLRLLGRTLYGYIGWVGHGNVGDEAVFEGLKHISQGQEWTTVMVGRRCFPAMTRLHLNSTSLFSDVVLGGGTLMGRPGMFHDAVERLGTIGHRLWAFGTGVGSCGWDGEPHPDVSGWKELLSRFAGIGVRGPLSKLQLDTIGVQGVEVVGDLALSLVKDVPSPVASLPRIAINLSCPSGRTLDIDMLAVMAAVTRLARRRLRSGCEIIPIAMTKDDRVPLAGLCENLKISRNAIRLCKTPKEVLDVLQGSAVLVGVRLHSAVLATCVGVPPVLLGYRSKCQDFMSSMGLLERCIDLGNGWTERDEHVLDVATEPGNNSAELRQRIIARAHYWRDAQIRFFTRLASAQ